MELVICQCKKWQQYVSVSRCSNPGREHLVQTDPGTSKGTWQQDVQWSKPEVKSRMRGIYLHSTICQISVVFRQKDKDFLNLFFIKRGIADNTVVEF